MKSQRTGLSFFIIILAWVLQLAHAQVVPLYDVIYRPPGLRYSVLRGDHFDIIFERGLRKQASETLYVLESSLAGTDSLTGAGFNTYMPVVLNQFNDRANGFVTSYPFKQEIAAIRSFLASLDVPMLLEIEERRKNLSLLLCLNAVVPD